MEKCPYHEDIIKDIKKITSAVESLQVINVKNGSKKQIPIHNLLAEIWECSEILRDFNKFHCICKKYKLYRITFAVFSVLALVAIGVSIKGLILKFLN